MLLKFRGWVNLGMYYYGGQNGSTSCILVYTSGRIIGSDFSETLEVNLRIAHPKTFVSFDFENEYFGVNTTPLDTGVHVM